MIFLTQLSDRIEHLALRSQDEGDNNKMKEIVEVLRFRQGLLGVQYDLYIDLGLDGRNLYCHLLDHKRYIEMFEGLLNRYIEEVPLSSEINKLREINKLHAEIIEGKNSFAEEPLPGSAGIGSGQARGQKKSANPITEFFRYDRSVIKSAVSAIIKNISQMFSGGGFPTTRGEAPPPLEVHLCGLVI